MDLLDLSGSQKIGHLPFFCDSVGYIDSHRFGPSAHSLFSEAHSPTLALGANGWPHPGCAPAVRPSVQEAEPSPGIQDGSEGTYPMWSGLLTTTHAFSLPPRPGQAPHASSGFLPHWLQMWL